MNQLNKMVADVRETGRRGSYFTTQQDHPIFRPSINLSQFAPSPHVRKSEVFSTAHSMAGATLLDALNNQAQEYRDKSKPQRREKRNMSVILAPRHLLTKSPDLSTVQNSHANLNLMDPMSLFQGLSGVPPRKINFAKR